MKITNTSHSVVTFAEGPAFQPGETREVSDDLGAQLLTRAEFAEPKNNAKHEPEKKSHS